MHQTNNARFLDLLWRHVLSICLVTVALLVSYSRYGATVSLLLSYSLVACPSQQPWHSLSCLSHLILHWLYKSELCRSVAWDSINKSATCVVLHRSIYKTPNQLNLCQFPTSSSAMLHPPSLPRPLCSTKCGGIAPCLGTPASAACGWLQLISPTVLLEY